MILVSSPYVEILYEPNSHRLVIVWNPVFTPSRQLRPILLSVCEFLRVHQPRRWLCDHSAMRIVSPEDQEWVVSDWVPTWCVGRGDSDRRVAVVKSRDVFGLRSVTNVTRRIANDKSRLALRLFDTRRDAEEWLDAPSVRLAEGESAG